MTQKKSSADAAPKKTAAAGKKTVTEKKTAPEIKPLPPKKKRNNRGLNALILFVLGVCAFFGYFTTDGVFIKFLRGVMSAFLGGGFYILSPALIICSVLMAFKKDYPKSGVVCLLLLPLMAGAFCQLFGANEYKMSFSMFKSLWIDGRAVVGGGVLGGFVTTLLVLLLSKTLTAIVLVCVTAFMLLSASGLTVSSIIQRIREQRRVEKAVAEEQAQAYAAPENKNQRVPELEQEPRHVMSAEERRLSAIDIPVDEPRLGEKAKAKSAISGKRTAVSPDEYLSGKTVPDNAAEPEIHSANAITEQKQPEPIQDVRADEIKPTPVIHQPVLKKEPEKTDTAESFASLIEESAKRDVDEAMQVYKFPPLSLLAAPVAGKTDARAEVMATKERLEMTLRSFGVNVNISNIINGPSVTRYEMELEIGVKLNKLTSLADDIALSLGVSGVRIAAIPNKISTVGIEVPNKNVSTVYLRELISSSEFQNASSKLTFAIGKNIGGDVMVGNIAKLPHLLVAGTTGSGKSVCLNSLILSLMYKATPEEVKFIMIDPKMVEFKIYNGIPHLLVPVVTEAKKAAGALQWAVVEMMKRYRLFSDAGVRDLAGYNEAMKQNGEPTIPQVVVIIDELADLMLVAAKEVEESICRVAQMGRAAGMHLVIATQSPRADVITGLMKANIPSRIAFKVASSLESRIILDAGGAADTLVGNGDMLFAPIGTSKPTRIQGAWVSDEEREKIVEFVKSSCQANYSEDVIDQIEKASADKDSGSKNAPVEEKQNDYDELLPQAVDVIFDTNQASVSMLQRRLKLGYSRAARLVDQMEEIGVVGPFEGSKPRQILITRQQWQEMQFVNGTAPLEKLAEMPTEPSQTVQNMFSADDLFDSDDN